MKRAETAPQLTPDQSRALASPLRLEVVGLFSRGARLSIADMAEHMGVRAGSLYHHVRILEGAGLLRQAGTRRKGKRDEALFEPVRTLLEVPLENAGEPRGEHARRAVAAAFRMAERDFVHALDREDLLTEGDSRNLFATRAHFLASPRLLARINKHLDAILDVLAREGARRVKRGDPPPEGRHMSLTLALLPLRSRRS